MKRASRRHRRGGHCHGRYRDFRPARSMEEEDVVGGEVGVAVAGDVEDADFDWLAVVPDLP